MSPGRSMIEYVPKRNRFSTSYGLVVFTKYPSLRAMIVERKLPYCLTNHLVNKAKKQSFTKILNTKNNNEKVTNIYKIVSKSVIEWIQNLIKSYCFEDEKILMQNKYSDLKDFMNFKSGKIFEDKYDFPHGQMTRRTKNYLNEKIKFYKRENSKYSEYYINLLKKFAGFITAFTEFEEETGYTFRFDSNMVKNDMREIILSFKGLDGYNYEQHFFIVTVDKIEKLKNYHMNRHRIVANEIDRELYIPKFVDIEEGKKLFFKQEREVGKADHKNMLLCSRFANLYNNMSYNCFDENDIQNLDEMDEKLFLDFIKYTEPNIYFRKKSRIRRIRWRDH